MTDYNKTLRDNGLKKYKLTDLVANGSRARLKVDSDLLVGDSSNGFAYGDILDANATQSVVSSKLEDLKQELLDEISQLSGGSEQDYSNLLLIVNEILTTINEINQAITDLDTEHDDREAVLLQELNTVKLEMNSKMTASVDNDTLKFE